MRSVFNVSQDVPCRVWHRYMTSTYELFSDPNHSLKNAGVYNGQVCVCYWLRGGDPILLPSPPLQLSSLAVRIVLRRPGENYHVMYATDVIT